MYFLAMYAPFFFLSLFWILFIEGSHSPSMGELIQKRAGHDCRFNDLRLCHYFPRLAHRGLFRSATDLLFKSSYLPRSRLYLFQATCIRGKIFLGLCRLSDGFPHDRGGHLPCFESLAEPAFRRCFPRYLTHLLCWEQHSDRRLYSDLQNSERSSVFGRDGRSAERHRGRKTCAGTHAEAGKRTDRQSGLVSEKDQAGS